MKKIRPAMVIDREFTMEIDAHCSKCGREITYKCVLYPGHAVVNRERLNRHVKPGKFGEPVMKVEATSDLCPCLKESDSSRKARGASV